MTLLQWFIFFLAVQVVHYLGTWKLYKKAGRKTWEAAVPVYNAVILMKIIRKPVYWAALLFIPIVNLIMFPVVWVLTLKSFGKKSSLDTILGIVTLGFYIYYINYAEDVKYITKEEYDAEKKKESTLGSLLFAIVVATIVHTYVMQPFTIPTASLEKTLLIGDFLFVSKFHYGARTPMTTVALPMVHDSVPVVNTKSYLSWPQLPSFRFPGFEKPEKNDIVVFNWPTDKRTDGTYKPIDKKTNYVKRCVGTPGDSLSIKDGVVYIDNKELILSSRADIQYSYIIKTDGTILNDAYLKQKLHITDEYGLVGKNTYFFRALTNSSAETIKSLNGIISVERNVASEADPTIFPTTKTKSWSQDNMGPIYIPEAGKTVSLTKETLPFYEDIIKEYEGNKLQVTGNEIRINGEIATSYTFKQNYYWMMGDNRHNSLDSRYWGFVPEDHIVGKPVFIWMSLDQNVPWKNFSKKVRWDRMFTTVGGEGKPVSYFKYFLILLAGWFVFDYFRKKKKKATN
ncbi:signal peptidase I [Flavobacterium sp. ST-75]|uniref:Signal peptidase I n=1 Tax=Flavobacterium rhizophilum TaxID=3163296 RepID=A0ABW8YGJ0_9FLAO